MGNDEPRCGPKLIFNDAPHLFLEIAVDPARCLIKDYVPRPVRDHPADSDELFFSFRKVAALFGDYLIGPLVGKSPYEPIDPGVDRLTGGKEVFPYRPREYVDILRDNAKGFPYGLQGILGKRPAPYAYFPSRGQVKTEKEVNEGRFP